MSKHAANERLSGIRLIDRTHVLSGPFAGMLLADLDCDTFRRATPGAADVDALRRSRFDAASPSGADLSVALPEVGRVAGGARYGRH